MSRVIFDLLMFRLKHYGLKVLVISLSEITCSKLAIGTLEQGAKYVQI